MSDSFLCEWSFIGEWVGIVLVDPFLCELMFDDYVFKELMLDGFMLD